MDDWIEIECGNLDSCEEGDTHLFPQPGSLALVSVPTDMRIISSPRFMSVPPGKYVVTDVLYTAHQAALRVGDELVWADVDDDISQVKD